MLSSKGKTLTIGLGLLIVIAILTNPGQEQHAAAFMTYQMNHANSVLTAETRSIPLDKELSVSTLISTRNLLVCSITALSQDNETRNIGFGAFGNVWIWQH